MVLKNQWLRQQIVFLRIRFFGYVLCSGIPCGTTGLSFITLWGKKIRLSSREELMYQVGSRKGTGFPPLVLLCFTISKTLILCHAHNNSILASFCYPLTSLFFSLRNLKIRSLYADYNRMTFFAIRYVLSSMSMLNANYVQTRTKAIN